MTKPLIQNSGFIGNRFKSKCIDCVIEAVHQIGSGVQQRSVKIEYDQRFGHGSPVQQSVYVFRLGQQETDCKCGGSSRCLSIELPTGELGSDCRRLAALGFTALLGAPAMVTARQSITGSGRRMDARQLKIEAARVALDSVETGMKLGIGTGSTAEEFVRLLAEKVEAGLTVRGVPTSERTAGLCVELGVPIFSLDELPHLDLTVDGADEVDPELRLIKGGGGALLREKIVAAASDRLIVIADESKVVDVLGNYPLPIEVNVFGLTATRLAVEKAAEALDLAGSIDLRMDRDVPFETDGGNQILDASFGRIPDAEALSAALQQIPGVVEHGLFLDLASAAIIAGETGIRTLKN